MSNITDKIAKLLALGESPVAAEAEAAMAKARRLLLEHGLEMQDIAKTPEGPAALVVEEAVIDTNDKMMRDWEALLLSVVADFFSCSCFKTSYRGNGKSGVMVGVREDVQAASRFYANIHAQMLEESRVQVEPYVERLRAEGHRLPWSVPGSRNPNRWISAWLVAAVRGLKDRLREERKSDEKGWGLVVTSHQLATKSYIDQTYGRMTKGRPMTAAYHADASSKGYATGRTMQERHDRIA